MIIFGSCVGDGGRRHGRVAAPWLHRAAASDDLIVTEPGDDGICAAYNRLIDRARRTPKCEALVLLHDDLQLIDVEARAKIREGVQRRGVGVVGVIGGIEVPGAHWWNAATVRGGVYETRGFVSGTNPALAGPVHALDGMLLVLAPSAFGRLRFDDLTFPAFHGYDADLCAQARQVGLGVEVIELDVYHRAKTHIGHRPDFDAAHRALMDKWPDLRPANRSRHRLVAGLRRRLQTVLPQRPPELPPDDSGGAALHEAVLDAEASSVARLAAAAEGLREIEIWLEPRADNEVRHRRLLEQCERGGIRVVASQLTAPPTRQLTQSAADARARHLRDGGGWPVRDLIRLTVSA